MIQLQVKHLKGFEEQLVGLIGAKSASPVLLRTRFGIHTFGMSFPIDVVILDKKRKVVRVVEALKPNRIFVWSPRFDTVLELPIGTVRKYSLKVGSLIHLELL